MTGGSPWSPEGTGGSGGGPPPQPAAAAAAAPPALNDYLTGSPFRGLARSASDVGTNGGGNEGLLGGGVNNEDGDRSSPNEDEEEESLAADESLLVSPILADYLGGSDSGAGGVSGGGSGTGKKSRPRTSQGDGGGRATASRPTLENVPEEEDTKGNNESVPAAIDLAGLTTDNATAAAGSSEPVFNLGAHLQLDTSLCPSLGLDTSMCPSLGLGSVGSDDENEDVCDVDNNNVGDIGDAAANSDESAQLLEPTVPETIGASSVFEDAAVDGDDVTNVKQDIIAASNIAVSKPEAEEAVVEQQQHESITKQLDETDETSPIHDSNHGDDVSGEAKDLEMNYSADSAETRSGLGSTAVGTENCVEDGVNLAATTTSNAKEKSVELENIEDKTAMAKDEDGLGDSFGQTPLNDGGSREKPSDARPTNEADVVAAGTVSTSACAAARKRAAEDDDAVVVAGSRKSSDTIAVGMGIDPVGHAASALDDPLKCSLSPIGRNFSSSPVLTRSPNVAGDSLEVMDNNNEEVQEEAPINENHPAANAPSESKQPRPLFDIQGGNVSANYPTRRKKPAEENQALSMSAQNIGKQTLAACSNALLFVGEQVQEVVEAAVKSTDGHAKSTDTSTSAVPEADTQLKNTTDHLMATKEIDEPIGEEEIFSHMHPSNDTADAKPPSCSMKSLTFSPLAEDIPPETKPEHKGAALLASSISKDPLSAFQSPPVAYHSTNTPVAGPSPSSDLSSAKKKLGASSHALVERLRGAAQKRKLLVTRSRDSFVAKEQKQKQSLENAALSAHAEEEEEEVHKAETPKPVQPTVQKRRFEGINPVREFKARPLPATTGDLGGGGQAGVPKVSKRASTVPSSPLLGNRRRLKEEGVGESKAYQKVKEEERRRREMAKEASARKLHVSNTAATKKQQTPKKTPFVPFKARPLPATTGDLGHGGQTGIPKVAKRSPTIPSSPLLGHRRPSSTSQPSKTYQVVAREKKMSKQVLPKPTTKSKSPSALRAPPFDRLMSGSEASRAKEIALKEKRERQEAEARRKSSFRARPLPATTAPASVSHSTSSPGLVGLELLGGSKQKKSSKKTSMPYPGEENLTPSNDRPSSAESQTKKQRIGSTLPDRLHSTKRAKERAQYDELRLSYEKERQQTEMEERKRIIRETSEELDELRDQI